MSRRTSVIRNGPGAGLRINPAGTNPGYALGTSELPVQEALAAAIEADSVVWDIGANVGFFSLIAAKLAPGGRVVAFEPLPSNAEAIRANAALNELRNIEVAELALSDFEGSADLQVHGEATWAKLDTSEDTAVKTDQEASSSLAVAVSTIDGQLASFEAPDVLKIDIEGAEAAALRGATRLLSEQRPVVICELHGTNDAVSEILERHGYSLDTIEQPGTHPREARWSAHVIATPGP